MSFRTFKKCRYPTMKAKSVSSLVEGVKSGQILSSSSEWKIGSDELFVTCLNCGSESKIKPIKNYPDLFINISLNHMSIRSCLVSQPNSKLIWNDEQLFNAIDLSPITFSVILPPNLCSKNSKNFKINPGTLDENKILKFVLSKYFLDSNASELIVHKEIVYKCHRILKDKKNKWSTMVHEHWFSSNCCRL